MSWYDWLGKFAMFFLGLVGLFTPILMVAFAREPKRKEGGQIYSRKGNL